MTPLRAIGWPFEGAPDDPTWREVLDAHPQARPARVVEQHRSGYLVADTPDTSSAVESLPEWQRPPGYKPGMVAPEQRPAVGDWVLVQGNKIVALLPRRSAIKRGGAGEHYQQQVIAANIDTVFVVCGLDADFNPRRIERYLLLVYGGGATPVVVLTKADKFGGSRVDTAIAALDDLAAQGVAIVAINAKDPDSVAVLQPWLGPGRSAVLVGSSGAGKSTLTNTLLGVERMKTNTVRKRDARGRHTTSHRALIPLASGACLIDTPGMRELKPTGEENVAENFTDVETLAQQCKFRDCQHGREPGCAVRAAIQAGTLDSARYGNFLKLRDEVAGAANKLETRRMQNSEEKGLGKPLNKRLDDKSGGY